MITIDGDGLIDLAAGNAGPGVFDEGEPDPMGSVANLVDAMLVFACGLMLALVMRYNIDLPNIQELVQDSELTESDEADEVMREIADGASYDELGTVYEDPETGRKYLLVEEE